MRVGVLFPSKFLLNSCDLIAYCRSSIRQIPLLYAWNKKNFLWQCSLAPRGGCMHYAAIVSALVVSTSKSDGGSFHWTSRRPDARRTRHAENDGDSPKKPWCDACTSRPQNGHTRLFFEPTTDHPTLHPRAQRRGMQRPTKPRPGAHAHRVLPNIPTALRKRICKG